MLRTALASVLMLSAISAGADVVTATEFIGAPPASVYYQAPRAPALVNQSIAISASSAQSAAFGATTGLLRVHCDVACRVVVGGTNPTATSTSMRLAAGQTEYFVVTPGDKLAAVKE